ncbi:ribosome-inactivating family protein [Spiroplasma endosymbiont of Lonchoptera lutea]|uniref:ribosome-inactivating family protein n=1 Tax=Spiroplasma endosymbiont of Lonchoptera lutea TaxID=3066297 RepID=UPI0030D165B0
MKKLLGLLGTILITGNALSTVIAVAPNRKQRTKNKLLNSELNYSQTNNLEKLIRNKRQNNEDISTTPKIQDEQQSQSSKNTDSQTDIIEKEVTWDENYSENIQKILQELIIEKYLVPLRSINMGGLISKDLDNKDNKTIISKLEELEPKMANWIKEQQNNKEKILILTLKNSNNKSIKLVINLNNLYLLGFINNQNKYFYFDDELLETIRQANQNEITKLGNLKTDLENFKKLMIEKNKNNEKKEKLEWKIKEKLNKLKILEKWKEELKQVKKPEEIKKIEENIKDIDKIIEEKINNTKVLNKLNKELIEAKKSKNKQQSDKIN